MMGQEAYGLLSLGEILNFNREGFPLYRDDLQSLSLCLTGTEVQPICNVMRWHNSIHFFRCNPKFKNQEEDVNVKWKHGKGGNPERQYRREYILNPDNEVFVSYALNILNVMRAAFLVQLDRKLGNEGRNINNGWLGKEGFKLRSPYELKLQVAKQLRCRYTPLGNQPVESAFYYPLLLEEDTHICIDLRRGTDRKLDDIDEQLVKDEFEGFLLGYLNNYPGRIQTDELKVAFDREDRLAILYEMDEDEEWNP